MLVHYFLLTLLLYLSRLIIGGFVDNNTIKLIYNIFKNCKEYFLQMKDFDGYEVDFSLLLKKIASFKNKKQLLLQKAEGGAFKPKKNDRVCTRKN